MTYQRPESRRAYDRQYQLAHRDQIRAYNRLYKELNRERIRRLNHERYLRQRSLMLARNSRRRPLQHGLTIPEYEAMLVNQDNTCAICRKPFKATRRPNIDHDHDCCPGKYSCGKCVRGLLCTRCNQTLGLGAATLTRALAYIYIASSFRLPTETPAAAEGGGSESQEPGEREVQAASPEPQQPSSAAPADPLPKSGPPASPSILRDPPTDDPGAAFRG
jgi:hypothetical protein